MGTNNEQKADEYAAMLDIVADQVVCMVEEDGCDVDDAISIIMEDVTNHDRLEPVDG